MNIKTQGKAIRALLVLAIIVALTIICAVCVIASAEKKTYTITYYSNGGVSKVVTVEAGGRHELLKTPLSYQQSDKKLFGWYDETGKLYSNITFMNISKDYTFYEAYGKNAGTEADFIKAIKQGGCYVRLSADIVVDDLITLPASGLAIIDLNGHNLTINSKDVAIRGMNSSIHVLNNGTSANASIIHTGEPTNADLMDSALFSLTPTLKRDAEIRFFPNANVKTNVGLFDIVSDLTYSNYTYNFLVESNVEANFLVRTYGIKNATFNITDTASINIIGQYMFEDRGNYNGINLTYEMTAGKLDVLENTFITNELSKYNVFLSGGSYNRSLSHLYPNYTFELGNDGRYTVTACKHADVIIDMTATCTSAGQITYQCLHCGVVHTDNSNAVGHSVVKSLAQEPITTVEKTEPGYYATVCQRCGYEEREYLYPSPKDVYVTVKIRDDEGKVSEKRVKATDLYGMDVGERLQSFSTAYLEFEYKIKQSNIISIEIPLGVKTVAGGIGTDNTPKGLFYGNSHLEEIILPMSIENIESTAFGNIATLKTVKGIEYITGTISQRAFQQTKGNVPYVERMELNAKTIETSAFENFTMISLTFGENVNSIGNYAFAISDIENSKLKEIFVLGNNDRSQVTLSNYNVAAKRFEGVGSGHQFDGQRIVYIDHNFDVETINPTCKEKGYDVSVCRYCNEERIDNYTDIIDHITEERTVPTNCVTIQGYVGSFCTMCDELISIVKYLNKNGSDGAPLVHDYTYTTKTDFEVFGNTEKNICVDDYFIVGVCICGAYDENRANWKYNKAVGQHEWDERNVLEYVAPTCGSDGYRIVECLHCGYEDTIIHTATGKHMYVTDNKNTIPATCTSKGKMVWACSECGDAKERKAEINPNNHDWEKDKNGNLVWTTKVAPTTERAGTAKNVCTGCGAEQTKGIPVTSEDTKSVDTLYIILIIIGGIIVLAGVGLTLYFTVFKKSASSGYKYKFNTLGKK